MHLACLAFLPLSLAPIAATQEPAAIAPRELVLVRDRDDCLPLRAAGGDRPLLVTLLDHDESALARAADATAELRLGRLGVAFARVLAPAIAGDELRLSPGSSATAIAAVAKRVGEAEAVLLAVHAREPHADTGLPSSLRPILDALRVEQRVLGVSFGPNRLLQQLPVLDTWLCAFASTESVENAAAAALLGQVPIVGRLADAIPGELPAGGGLSLYADEGSAAGPELAAELPRDLEALLRQAVAAGAFPGAVCLVARGGRRLVEVAVGVVSDAADAPPMVCTLPFDLASLTKVCATLPAVLRLVAAGKLSLDDPVAKWVPGFVGTGKERVTVRHLLAHQAGLPAYERFYRTLRGRDAILAAAAAEPLMSEPGTGPTYSDLGFMLLMAVVEACSGERFEAFVEREVLQPFGMARARFVPTDGPPLLSAPPTERFPVLGLRHGHVHDENAFAMAGVSGHAGLFATAGDVLAFGLCCLGGGRRGGRGLLPRALVELAQAPSGFGDDQTRGLGFQRLTSGSWAGTEVPPGTFGHTGFTGTSLWCCPRHDLCVVLLTNRVHPTRVNNKITGVRTAVHDLVLAAVR